MAEERTILLKVDLDVSLLEKNAKEAEKKLGELTPKLKELRKENKQNTIEYKETQLEIKAYNKQLTDSVKSIQTFRKASEEQTGSLNETKDLLAAAVVGFSRLTKAQQESEFGKKTAADMLKLKEAVNNTQESYGTFTGTVGDYEGAIKRASAQSEILQKEVAQIGFKIGDTTKNIKDSTDKLNDLRNEGKENTQMYVKLESEISDFNDTLVQQENELQVTTNALNQQNDVLTETTESARKIGFVYEKTTDATKELGDETTDLSATFEDVNGDLKPLSGRLGELEDRLFELALAGKTNTKEFVDLRAEAVRYRKTIIAVDASVDQLAEQGARLGPALQIAEGVVQGYQAFAGVTALVGGENEELLAILVKLEGAQAVLNSIEAAQTSLRKNSINITNLQARAQKGLNLAIGTGTKASKLFRGALLATGIGAIIIGISLLIANFDKLKAALSGSSKAQLLANDISKSANEAVSDQLSALDRLQTSINDVNISGEERNEIIKEFNEEHPALLAGIDAETASLEELNVQIGLNAKLLTARAELEVIAQKRSETFKDVLDLQTEALTGQNVGIWDYIVASKSSATAQQFANESTKQSIDLKNKEIKVLDNLEKAKEDEIDLLLKAGAIGKQEISDADAAAKAQETRDKKAEAERKKRAKEAEAIAKKLREVLLENIELSNDEQREAIEKSFKFRQEISKDDADALLIIEAEKNKALREIELNELQLSIDRKKVSQQKEIEQAKGNKELLQVLEINHREELEAINREFDTIQEERDRKHLDNLSSRNEEIKEIEKDRVNLAEKTSDEIEVIRAQSALDAVKDTDQELAAFKRLQDAKIALLEETARQQLENDELTSEEREKIEAELAARIQEINRETLDQQEEADELSIEKKKAIAFAITSAAQQLGASLVQIAKNNIQKELNADQEKFDEQSILLKENFDNGIITQAEFESEKAALENNANKKASALKLKQFKLDKAAALIQAGIGTSLAVIQALAGSKPPISFILAGISATLGAVQIATIASQPTPKFDKGGKAKVGKFGGNLHSSGGTKGMFDDGTRVEVEKDEAFFILNRRATSMINTLSDHNAAHGGNSFMQDGGVLKFQGGGTFATNVSASVDDRFASENRIIQAASALPAPIVLVEDIIAGQKEAIDVRDSANF